MNGACILPRSRAMYPPVTGTHRRRESRRSAGPSLGEDNASAALKVLQREARVFRPRLLGGLPLHHRTTAATVTFCGLHMPGWPSWGPKKLHPARTGEGVAEMKKRARSSPVPGAPVRSRAAHREGDWRLGAGAASPKQALLSGEPFLLANLRFAEGVVEGGDQLGALAAQRIAGTRVDQRLDDALVAQPQVDAIAQLTSGD